MYGRFHRLERKRRECNDVRVALTIRLLHREIWGRFATNSKTPVTINASISLRKKSIFNNHMSKSYTVSNNPYNRPLGVPRYAFASGKIKRTKQINDPLYLLYYCIVWYNEKRETCRKRLQNSIYRYTYWFVHCIFVSPRVGVCFRAIVTILYPLTVRYWCNRAKVQIIMTVLNIYI